MKNKHHIARLLLSAALLALTLGANAGCAASKPAMTPVVLQLNWSHSVEFTGYYVAYEKGYYADEGLNVTINAGGIPPGGTATINAQQLLADGKADFAVLAFTDRLAIGNQGVALASIYQLSPRVIFSLKDSKILTPMDMTGRRVAIKSKGWKATVVDTMTAAGADATKIVEVPVKITEQNKLYSGEVEVWTGFVMDEAVKAELDGYPVNIIFPAEYGVGFYDGLLATRPDIIQDKPDLAKRFLRATVRGWQYTIANTQEAGEILAKYETGREPKFYQAALHATIPLIDTGQVRIGWIDNARWQRELQEQKGTYDPGAPGYTMDFLSDVK